ncbi:MAG: hypothetical protein NXY57DRAFT_870146, partial [Lentinula lateritia]
GMNPYDISVPCDGSIEEILSYRNIRCPSRISEFLSLPPIRAQLGVGIHPEVRVKFNSCDLVVPVVGAVFYGTHYILHFNQDYVPTSLERGVRVYWY